VAMEKNGWNYTTIFKNDIETTKAGVLEVCETESTIEFTVEFIEFISGDIKSSNVNEIET